MPEKFVVGQLVAFKTYDSEKTIQQKKLVESYFPAVIVRIYTNCALVQVFGGSEFHLVTPKLKRLVPAQKIFKWMKKCNVRIV